MDAIPSSLIQTLLAQYVLNPDGIHGTAHWKKVQENGLYLAEQTGADPVVVQLFGLFHDVCRLSDGPDPEHGPRGGKLARELCGTAFQIDQTRLDLLVRACDTHTIGEAGADEDITVLTCWDADRLDFWRLKIEPDTRFLSTDAAKLPETIQWARNGR